jgi:hypothetical protein
MNDIQRLGSKEAVEQYEKDSLRDWVTLKSRGRLVGQPPIVTVQLHEQPTAAAAS